MKQFLTLIINAPSYNEEKGKWDDYRAIFYKYLECEDLDVEEQIPAKIELYHFINLFLSDIVFFFVTNFCEYKELNFTTSFHHFPEFMEFVLNFVSNSCHNPLKLFIFSDKKRRVFDVECEKTEYKIKDHFNHYGISLIFLEMFLRNEKNYLPKIISDSSYSSLLLNIIHIILVTDNKSDHIFNKYYQQLVLDLIKVYSSRGYEDTSLLSLDLLKELNPIKFNPEQFLDIYKDIFINFKGAPSEFDVISFLENFLQNNLHLNQELLNLVLESLKSFIKYNPEIKKHISKLIEEIKDENKKFSNLKEKEKVISILANL
jgi:hypothetical protein